jgi:hypothetical protein
MTPLDFDASSYELEVSLNDMVCIEMYMMIHIAALKTFAKLKDSSTY